MQGSREKIKTEKYYEKGRQARGKRSPSSGGVERLELGGKKTSPHKKLLHKQSARYIIDLKPAYFKMSFTKLSELILIHRFFNVMD